MNALYDAPTNSLTEQAEMHKPEEWEYYDAGAFDDRPVFLADKYSIAAKRYNAHIATLRTIPCSPEAKEVFKDKRLYEEGKDYRLVPAYLPIGDGKGQIGIMAKPNTLQQTEDPYEELVSMIHRSSWDRAEQVAELKKQFIITKR